MSNEEIYSQARHMLMIILGNCMKKGFDYDIDCLLTVLKNHR